MRRTSLLSVVGKQDSKLGEQVDCCSMGVEGQQQQEKDSEAVYQQLNSLGGMICIYRSSVVQQ